MSHEAKSEIYERMQTKTFTRWSNKYLASRKMVIKDLKTDLCDGVKLNALLEIIGNAKIKPLNRKPRMKIQRIENLQACVKFIQKRHVKLVGISAEDIEEGNIKLILGLMWTVILRFFIADGAAENTSSTKKKLLQWVNKQIAPYRNDGVHKVTNFDKSWQDGKALSALTDSLKPGLIKMKNLGNPINDCENAINIADQEFGIAPMVDAEDIVQHPCPHSMMTYISYFRDCADGDIEKKKEEEARKRREEEEAKEKKRAAEDRAKKWEAVGPGVEGGFRNRDLPFILRPLEAGLEAAPQEFQVFITKNEQQLGTSKIHETEDGKLQGSWIGNETGEHVVKILLDGEPIANSPYEMNLFEPADVKQSYAEGPGLKSARDDKQTHFTVFCKDQYGNPVKREDALEVSMDYSDGSHVEPSIKDNGDGSYTVKYQAQKPGDLHINVMIAQKSIKNMPVDVHVQSGSDIDKLMSEIDKLRKKLGLPKRQYTDEELNDPNAIENLQNELRDLKDVDKLTNEIQDIRKKLGMDKRHFTDDELIGTTAVSDRIIERDDLKEQLAQKNKVDPLVAKIQKLRKQMEMSKREFDNIELMGAHAVEDRSNEITDLEEILPIYNDINQLRKKLAMPKRQFEDIELDHFQNKEAIPDRIRERRDLRNLLKNKAGTDPLIREIQKLRRGLGLEAKEFTDDEKTGNTAVEDRTKERDDLNDVTGLVAEIQKLRKQLDLPHRNFTEDELTGPNAVEDLIHDRDHLATMVPIVDQIQDLRKQLDKDQREYEEDELIGEETIPDREAERDELLDALSKKRLIDPLVDEIQKLRKNLDLEEKKFTVDELEGDTAVEDRTEERNNLKAVTPLVRQIENLRKKLDMEPRDYCEDELTGPTGYEQQQAIADRKKERDDLLDKLGTKEAIDPILHDINKLRAHMELEPKEWTEDEKKDIKGRINERDHLQHMTELHDNIHELRNELEMDKRDFDEYELVGPNSIPDRTKERDLLRAQLDRKRQTDPIVKEIQQLHQQLNIPPREFEEEELIGPTAVKDRIQERADLQQMAALVDDITGLRKELEMSPRDFDDTELTSNDEPKRTELLDDRTKERSDLREVLPIVEDIHDLREKLEMPRREDYEDYELYGGMAIPDRKDERDELKDKLKRKYETDPIIAEINKLRKQQYLEPKEYTEEEVMGENAVNDRTEERDQLREVIPLADEIRKLRKKLQMPAREFDEEELTGTNAVEDRTGERDELLDKFNVGRKTNPLLAEIQRLRRRMEMSPRDFTVEEKFGPTAVEDRTEERDILKEVYPLYNEINKLRRKLQMPVRQFDDDELGGPDAVADRTEERDELLKRLSSKNQLEPLMRQIQKYRNQLDVPRRDFTEEELEDEDAIENLTEERNNLKKVIPLAGEIHRLRKKIEMDPRNFEEEELCGEDAVAERTEERDKLRDMLGQKKALDPILKEIQKLRKKLDLPRREFSDDEIYGDTAYDDRIAERNQLVDILPLVNDINKFRKKLDVPYREFEEDELCGEDAIDDRTKERDDLEAIGPVCSEIQSLRKQLDMDVRDFEDEELVGQDALEDREAERDELRDRLDRLKHLQPLIDEIQRLRRKLDMKPRNFEEGELDEDDADEMLQKEIDELLQKFNTRGDADKLAEEIQKLRELLNMEKREFTEEELDATDAVPKLTSERDDLRDELNRRNLLGDLPDEIQRLRKILGYKPRVFPDPIPVEMIPELEEERDDLKEECEERKKRAEDLLGKIGKLWKYLEIPKSDRPNLRLKKDEVPSKKWLDKAEKEYNRLRNMMKGQLQGEVDQQKGLLEKLWDRFRVPEEQRTAFYNKHGDLYTEEGLQALRDENQRLHQAFMSSKKILKLIQKREKFMQQMLEFEVVSSDPHRLFKKSTQLNKEEMFRKEAYPTLLKIEKEIRSACTEFEDKTGDGFMLKGEYYLVTLEEEIENRGLNLAVFGVAQGTKGKKDLNKIKSMRKPRVKVQKKHSKIKSGTRGSTLTTSGSKKKRTSGVHKQKKKALGHNRTC